MSELPGVSIVIPNYNYERFIAAAIESALAQDHPRCEVIVVDDRSTDGSRDVIARYGDRVRAILMPENGGQVAALNAAWPLARHEILIFLDSDDLLVTHAASTVARHWSAEIAKIQFPMASIDEHGQSLNHIAPKYPPTVNTKTLRESLLKFGTSPSTPGTGNAYAKWLLEKIAPIQGLIWMDALLEINAPFFGEVITLKDSLACYRMHGANWSLYKDLSVERFARHVRFFEEKVLYIERRCQEWGLPFDPEEAKRQSMWYLECQLVLAKLSSSDDPACMPSAKILERASKAVLRSPYNLKQAVILLTWLALVAASPRPWAKQLIDLRFNIMGRPRWFESLLNHVLRQPAPILARKSLFES